MINLRKSKRVVALALILFIGFGALAPLHNAQGQEVIAGIVIEVGFCVVSPWLNSAINRAIESGRGFLEGQTKNLLSKIGLGFLFGDDDETDSGSVPTDTILDIPRSEREEKDCISNQVKRRLIAAIVNDIIDFAKGNGDPRYIESFGEELKNAADGASAEFLREYTSVNICSYFSPHLRILVGNDVRRSLARPKRYSCTLTEAAGSLDRFFNDFRDGGWNTWISMHESSNTLLGAYLLAYNEKITLIEERKEAKRLEIQTGDGYKPTSKCTEIIIAYATESGFLREEGQDIDVGMNELGDFIEELKESNPDLDIVDVTCIKEEIIAPASLTADQVSTGVQAEIENLKQASEWYEIVSAILSRSVTKIIREGF